jgi:hypothetical protein
MENNINRVGYTIDMDWFSVNDLDFGSDLDFQKIGEGTFDRILGYILDQLNKYAELLSFEMVQKTGKTDFDLMTIKKDNIVKNWLNLDTALDKVVSNISEEIVSSSAKFDTDIESIELKEAYEDCPYKEIEIDVKVSEEIDINKFNDFSDYVGINVGKLLDKELFTSHEKEIEIRQRLLIVLSQ